MSVDDSGRYTSPRVPALFFLSLWRAGRHHVPCRGVLPGNPRATKMPQLPFPSEATLSGRVIAIPETRELDVFAAMLERRGATVLRCPLVAILDAPDPAPVLEWIRQFNADGCDDLILLTGEGLRRLLGCIDRHAPDLRTGFVDRLAGVRKITRGPKPARALRSMPPRHRSGQRPMRW